MEVVSLEECVAATAQLPPWKFERKAIGSDDQAALEKGGFVNTMPEEYRDKIVGKWV